MIIYMVESDGKTKVGMAEDESRARHYRTHSPNPRFVAKVFDLAPWDAELLERIVHEILGAEPGSEWTFASEGDVDRAISVATECMDVIGQARAVQIAFDLPRQYPDPAVLVNQYQRHRAVLRGFVEPLRRIYQAFGAHAEG